jgi:hypothetical protein
MASFVVNMINISSCYELKDKFKGSGAGRHNDQLHFDYHVLQILAEYKGNIVPQEGANLS